MCSSHVIIDYTSHDHPHLPVRSSHPGEVPFRPACNDKPDLTVTSLSHSPVVSLTCAASSFVHAKSLQLCPTLCDPMDCSPPGSSVHGILQARTLEWVAISSSRGSSQPRDRALHLLCWQAGSLPLAPPGEHLPLVSLTLVSWANMCIPSRHRACLTSPWNDCIILHEFLVLLP